MPQQKSPRITRRFHTALAVNVGPLTKSFISGAKWQGQDQFPATQRWANDVESVMEFLANHNRFVDFQDRIQKVRDAKHRDATLAEARGAYYLHRNGFKILAWEPLGEGNALGEALVQLGKSPSIFTEVKQPSWQGEHLPLMIADQRRLSPADRNTRLARMKQPRFLPNVCEGGAVGSHHFSMSVIRRNALHKLTAKQPNLVIVADDCNVSPVGLPSLAHYVQNEFLNPAHDPNDLEDTYTYERLGGVLFLSTVSFGTEVEYDVEYVENPYVIAPCALPDEVTALFESLTFDTERREERRYAGSNSFLRAIMNGWKPDTQPGN